MRILLIALPIVALGFPAARCEAGGEGYLGILISDVPDALAAQLGLEGGAMVAGVTPGSPAEKAGLQRFDVVTAIGDRAIKGVGDVKDAVRSRKPGEKVAVQVVRGGQTKTVEAVLGAREEAPRAQPVKPRPRRRGFLGVAFDRVPDALAVHLRLGEDKGRGVMVVQVMEDSPAKKAGIRSYDVLVALDGKPIEGPEAFRKAIGGKHEGDAATLEVIRAGERKKIEVRLAARPEEPFRWHPLPWRKGPGSITRMKGKIIIRDAEGREHVIEIPHFEGPEIEIPDLRLDFDDLHLGLDKSREEIEKELRDVQERMKRMIERLLKEHPEGPGIWSRVERSVIRKFSDGTHEITITGEGDDRRVTVKKGEETVAEDLPWDEIEKLPDDVREKVRRFGEGKIGPETAPAPPPLPAGKGTPI